MKRLLVTGASGFIGRQVILILSRRDWEIHTVSRDEADLRRTDAARTLIERLCPTHILHLAWNAEHGKYWTAADNEDWADGTIALARAFAGHGGVRFVGAGTCAEYDWQALGRDPCREGVTPERPHMPYGRAKLRAWQGVQEATATSHVSAAWGRLFLLYGPGEDPRRLVPLVARALQAGQRAQVTEGTQVRDFLHVADAACAFIALLESDITGPVNVGSGEPVTIRTIVETLMRLAERPDAVDFGALPMRPDDPPFLVANVERLHSTGWRPQISLEQGLAEMLVGHQSNR